MTGKLYQRIISYFSSDILSGRQVLDIYYPLLWEQLFFAFVALLGTWMIAGEGEAAISAVTMVNTFNFMFTQVCVSFGIGGTVMVAQYTGAQNPRLAAKTLQQSMTTSTLVGSAMTAVLLLAGRGVVGFFLSGAPQDVLDIALEYFHGISLSLPFFALYQGFAGGLRGSGQTKIALWLTLFVNCLEIAFSALFVLGFHLGVTGIAVAIIVSRAFGGLVSIAYVIRYRKELRITMSDFFRPSWPILRSLVHIAVPVALEQVFFHSGKAFTQRFIASYGTTHMVANAVSTIVYNIGIAPNSAWSTATLTIVGMAIGRERIDIARVYNSKFIRATSVMCLAVIIPVIPFTVLMAHLYHATPEAARLTYLTVGVFFFCAPLFVGRSSMTSNSLRAGGDAVYTSTVSLCSMWIVRVSLAYLFTRIWSWGVVGVVAAMTLEWGVRGLLFTLRFNKDKWYRHKLIVQE